CFAEIVRLGSCGSRRAARRSASATRLSSLPLAFAIASALRNAAQALAILPSFSRQSPRVRSVPTLRSIVSLASDFSQPSCRRPCLISARPSRNSDSAAGDCAKAVELTSRRTKAGLARVIQVLGVSVGRRRRRGPPGGRAASDRRSRLGRDRSWLLDG